MRVYHNVLAGTNAKSPPRKFAGFEIIRGQMAANPKLSARNPHDDLVVHNQWSRGHRLAQLWIAVLGAPDNFAGLRIEGVDVSVERGYEDLAVGISDAPVYQ